MLRCVANGVLWGPITLSLVSAGIAGCNLILGLRDDYRLAGEAGSDSPGSDSAFESSSDASAAPCDLNRPFNMPEQVGVINTTRNDYVGRLSPDELTIYFASDRESDAGGAPGIEIYVATRATTASAFSNPTKVAGVNTDYDEGDPSVSADGLTLYFQSFRSGTDQNIFVASRGSIDASFGDARPVPVNTTFNDQDPWITVDGTELWFTSGRGGGVDRVYRAPKNANGFGTTTPVTELNGSSYERGPALGADGLTGLPRAISIDATQF